MVSRKGKSPAMPFYGRDFYDDEHVKLMSLDQEGAYVRLLWHAWSHGSIPAEIGSLAKLWNVSAARAAKVWSGIAPCWVAIDGDRLAQKRLEAIRSEHGAHAEEMRALALRRWGKDAGAHAAPHADSDARNDAEADAKPHAVSQSSPSPSPKEGSKEGSLSVLTEEKSVQEIAQDLARARTARG
jgi:uncharacterized protein YdaU (DUF1376 family)